MHASTTPEPLPPTTTPSRSAQMRWLGIAAGVIVADRLQEALAVVQPVGDGA